MKKFCLFWRVEVGLGRLPEMVCTMGKSGTMGLLLFSPDYLRALANNPGQGE
jgi:hypothetical protein